MSGVIGVGYTASINNSDYLLEEDKSNNQIQITAQNDGTSGLCVLTQNESGNHTLQQKQLDWVPILLQKFQLPLLAVVLLYSPVVLTPLKISIRFELLLGSSNLRLILRLR